MGTCHPMATLKYIDSVTLLPVNVMCLIFEEIVIKSFSTSFDFVGVQVIWNRLKKNVYTVVKITIGKFLI